MFALANPASKVIEFGCLETLPRKEVEIETTNSLKSKKAR
jgi:hypothetical protein